MFFISPSLHSNHDDGEFPQLLSSHLFPSCLSHSFPGSLPLLLFILPTQRARFVFAMETSKLSRKTQLKSLQIPPNSLSKSSSILIPTQHLNPISIRRYRSVNHPCIYIRIFVYLFKLSQQPLQIQISIFFFDPPLLLLTLPTPLCIGSK